MDRADNTLSHKARNIVLVLFALAAISYGLLGLNYIQQTSELHKRDTQITALALRANLLGIAIQKQRRETILRGCVADNIKHLHLVDFLVRQGIERENQPTAYQFINTLVPLKNCFKVVKKATTPQ